MALVVQPWAHQIGWYMHNVLASSEGDMLFKVVDDHAQRLATRMSDADGEDDEEEDGEDTERDASQASPRGDDDQGHDDGDDEALSNTGESGSVRSRLSRDQKRADLKEFLSNFKEPPPVDEAVEDNITFAVEEFELSDLDRALLTLVVRYSNNRLLEDFCDEVHQECNSVAMAVAALTDQRFDDIQARLSTGSPLIEHGVLVVDRGGNGLSGAHGELRMTTALHKGMRKPCANREDWTASLLGVILVPKLPWSDYEHLGKPAELARRALLGWTQAPEPGVNIMLVGPPGTGKTELAKTLAQEVGLRIFSVGEGDDNDGEPSRGQRLASLRLAFAVLRNKRDCLLLLDEATDVLPSTRSFGSRKGDHSKLFLNRTLEGNPTPVIWACNDVSDMDPATLRRMTQIIEMKVPDPRARKRIWMRVFELHGMDLGQDVAGRLAARWPAAPAMAENAVRLAKMAGGGEADIEVALFGAMRVMGMSPQLPVRDGRLFDPELAVCTQDLAEFVAQACRPDAPLNWSALLYGPPGTTKSEFASHLATSMGLEIYRVRASNLLSKWVGESEQNISAAFAEARARNAVLIIDEIDSLIFNRSGASHSWEVSQVNEMLTWMEDHPLPFLGTTNALSQMDAASMRRFTHKLHFATLDPRRTVLAFQRILGAEPPPGGLPDGLSPGDFAAIKKKMAMLGPQSPRTLVRWLQEEMDAKGAVRREIGFRSRAEPEQLEARPD